MIPLKDDNPVSRRPFVTIGLILMNILVFLYELSLGPERVVQFIYEYGAVSASLVRGQELETLFTSMFLHGGFFHLAGNMLYLWIFGDNVEDYLGHWRFVPFYLACGIFATLFHIFLGGASQVPMLGASGAISGVLGAYLIKYPKAKVLVAIPILVFLTFHRIPAVFVLGLWFVMQLAWGLLSADLYTGIAFWAHIGGFIAGMLCLEVFSIRRLKTESLKYSSNDY